MKKGRIRWVATSGGFDPIHIGHIRMLKAARKLGDKLVVIINNDNWLRAKKGFVFMPQKERAEIIRALPSVDKVVVTDHKEGDPDRSVCRALRKLKPAVFANGGDRFKDNIPEAILCKKLGIKMVFNVGRGGKVQSSSWMVGKVAREVTRSVRPWGAFHGWDEGPEWKLKTIYIKPGKRLSLQYHHHRRECWLLVDGDATATLGERGEKKKVKLKKGLTCFVGRKQLHRLESKRGGVVVEVSYGRFDENDIVRIEDDHGRI
jgi:cytidyltransferase-like protein